MRANFAKKNITTRMQMPFVMVNKAKLVLN